MILFPLLLGLFIYLVFRDSDNPFYKWASIIGASDNVDILKNLCSNLSLPLWFIYSLPDGLWMFSCVLLMMTIWDYQINDDGLIWIVAAIVIGFIIEFTQMYFSKFGRFDWMDVIFLSIGAVLPLLFFKRKTNFELPFYNYKYFINE